MEFGEEGKSILCGQLDKENVFAKIEAFRV